MVKTRTQVGIHASAAVVWPVLADCPAYGRCDPLAGGVLGRAAGQSVDSRRGQAAALP